MAVLKKKRFLHAGHQVDRRRLAAERVPSAEGLLRLPQLHPPTTLRLRRRVRRHWPGSIQQNFNTLVKFDDIVEHHKNNVIFETFSVMFMELEQ